MFVLHKNYSHFPSTACSFWLCTVLSLQLPLHHLHLLLHIGGCALNSQGSETAVSDLEPDLPNHETLSTITL